MFYICKPLLHAQEYAVVADNERAAAIMADTQWRDAETIDEDLDNLGYEPYVQQCLEQYKPRQVDRQLFMEYVELAIAGDPNITVWI